MKSKIFYTKPSITNLEIEYANDAVKNGWGDKCYDYINKFEDNFRKFLGVDYAVATSSCTGALQMGLAALGIGHGDEVIMADTNWIATVSPIVHLGATPVFVDVMKDTWCLDPVLVESAVTSRTKAIIAVHLYGNLCEMNDLLAIGEKHGIPIIEDSAEAIGSIYGINRAGSLGKFGVFSFHGTKTITTGEGGMFVTSDPILYDKVLTLSNHGRKKGQERQFWPEDLGFKFKMSNIQAAIGCAQLERVDELTARKRAILNHYRINLNQIPGLSLNPEPKVGLNGAWMPTVVFDPNLLITRELMQNAFQEEGIDARPFFWPLSSLPMFKPELRNVNSWSIPSRSINLPSYHDISNEDLSRVTSVLLNVVGS
jgi:perosamine synthetase